MELFAGVLGNINSTAAEVSAQKSGGESTCAPYIGGNSERDSAMRNFSPTHSLFQAAQPMTHATQPGEQSSWARPLTLAAMSLGYGVVQLDVTIVNTALNSISSSLGGGVSELQWVVNAYTIAFAAFILTAGALGDRLGAKKVFMMGFALFTVASLSCALAPGAAVLIAA